MDINLDLSNLQKVILPKFYTYLKDKNRYQIYYGGAGSGKSWFVTQKLILKVIVGFKLNHIHRIIALRKTQPSCRQSVFAGLKSLITDWNLNDIVDINKSEMIFNFYNGSQIMCGGLDQEEKIKSVFGITDIWLEEANQFTKEDFYQLDLRLRTLTPFSKQIFLSFNPVSKYNWVYKEFFHNINSKATIIQSTYRDNRFLDKDYIERLEELAAQDKNFYQIYNQGTWGSLEHLIYNNYKIIDQFPDTFNEVIYGLDWGYNAPSALVFIGEKDKELFIKELLYQTKLTNSELIEKLKELIPDDVRKKRFIYCDSAEPQRIQELFQAGFLVYPSNKIVKDGINYIKTRKIILDSNSKNLLDEIESYSYKKDKDDNIIDDPVKAFDHLMDAMRYAIFTHYGEGKLKPGVY
jgi:phage terminase large subunit